MGNGTIVNVTETLKGERAAWRIETQLPAEIRGQLGELSVMISHLLYCRGYRTVDAIRGFFTQGTISHDPFLLPDMALAVERIEQARTRGERVAVYGDFDCD